MFTLKPYVKFVTTTTARFSTEIARRIANQFYVNYVLTNYFSILKQLVVRFAEVKSNEKTSLKKRRKKLNLKMKCEFGMTCRRCFVRRFNEEPEYFASVGEYNDYLELLETVGWINSRN